VPSSSDERIEELCSRIKRVCSGAISSKAETELQELAQELHVAIKQHVAMAKSSLRAKKAAIVERDPD
jgi:hypothetical protein